MVTDHPAEEDSLTAEPQAGPVTVAELTDPCEWDKFVERCPASTMAHLWQWGPLIRDVFGRRCPLDQT